MIRRPVLTAVLFAAFTATAGAQDTTKAKPEASKADMMDDHMMGPWKEMNAFHRVMGATWHPVSQKGDLAPLKARAKELLAAADTWAASKPPAMPASCGSKDVLAAVTKVAAESKSLAALIDSGADDARLKAALKGVHETFEVAEKSCAGHGEHGRTG
jgi:hypothetical protein